MRRRRRRLSRQEESWVNSVITEVCLQLSLNPGDEDYGQTAWAAFSEMYSKYDLVVEPAFWKMTCDRIEDALYCEKQSRNTRLYRRLSLDAPMRADNEETFLSMLPARGGDFTNHACFLDFLERLPEDLNHLAWSLINRNTLEETRSHLGWTAEEICSNVERLRVEITSYERI